MKKLYALRTCDSQMRSYNGFQWPNKIGTKITAFDWNEIPKSGNGLHGLLWGQGDGSLLGWEEDAKWLVVEIGQYVELSGKIKFPECIVRHIGDRKSATDYLIKKGANPSKCVGAFLTGGDWSTLTGGYKSTLTGGYGSTLTGGDRSTLTGGHGSTITGGHESTITGGYRSTLTGGNRSTLTGGHGSTLTGGNRSTLTGGYRSTLTGGNRSTLTGGNGSTLTGGNRSTLTGGNRSTLTGGHGSTLTGGNRSTLMWKIWDGQFYRIHAFYVGENGVEANKPYMFDGKGIRAA